MLRAKIEGQGCPLHVHHFEDEGFYILEGEMTFYVGDQTIKARPGSFLFGPKEVPHAFTVDSGSGRLLFVLSPAGFEELVREMGEPARELALPPQPEAPPDMETRYSGHRRGSRRNAWPPPVRAGLLSSPGPSLCPYSPNFREEEPSRKLSIGRGPGYDTPALPSITRGVWAGSASPCCTPPTEKRPPRRSR